MVIFHIISSLANGGAEKMTVELANEQQKLGNKVFIVIFDSLKPNMIHVKNLDKNVNILYIKRRLKFDLITIINLFVSIKRNKCDVIHTHKPSSVVSILPFLPFLNKEIKIVHTVHSGLIYYKNLFNFLSFFRVVRNRVVNVCLTDIIRQDYQNAYPKLIFFYVQNGISMPLTSENYNEVKCYIDSLRGNKSNIILFIGRNSIDKNLSLLFNCMFVLYNKDINCKLICLGLDKKEIISQYDVSGIIDKNTFILGSKSNIADYIANSDALILSSINEGMPLVVIEAMSYGKPIISTSVGGIQEMIENGVHGFLSDDISVEGLLSAIFRFLDSSDDEIYRISAHNINKYHKEFSIDSCCSAYLKIYTDSYM